MGNFTFDFCVGVWVGGLGLGSSTSISDFNLRSILEHFERKFGFTVISRLVIAVNIIARLSVQMMPVSVVMFSPTLSNLDLLVVSQKRQQVDLVHISQTF